MADISQIKIGDTTYDIKDATARQSIPTVPTNVSAFVNDAGYLTTVPTDVSSFNNDAGYLTLSTLPIYQGGVQ